MNLTCWKCGKSVPDVILPLSRREECPHCRAELCVCMQCEHYDARTANQCREERAERVSDKQRANFCDYFLLKPHAYAGAGKSAEVNPELAALFGSGESQPAPSDPLADLFKPKDGSNK